MYAHEGDRQLQEIVVNAQPRVHEAWSSDNWNGGTFGHALYLVVPEALFLSLAKQKKKVEKRIREDLNSVHNVPNEFIQEVFLEMEVPEDADWRKDSGVLAWRNQPIPPDITKRVWGDNQGFRLFLSHKAAVKKETSELAKELRIYGVSPFVAHTDIKPTRAWQDEIENALGSMDGFVALLTDGFHDSNWTDQEVGYAFARGVPLIAIRMGTTPYGFIGKFQALSCGWAEASKEIVKLLINNPRMLNNYIAAVHNCGSFENGNKLAELLPDIEQLDGEQAGRLVAAFNENQQVRNSFGFDGSKRSLYGKGLVHHLNRFDIAPFRLSNHGLIEADE